MSFVFFSLLQKQTTKRLLLLSFIAELICHVPPHTRKVCVCYFYEYDYEHSYLYDTVYLNVNEHTIAIYNVQIVNYHQFKEMNDI